MIIRCRLFCLTSVHLKDWYRYVGINLSSLGDHQMFIECVCLNTQNICCNDNSLCLLTTDNSWLTLITI